MAPSVSVPELFPVGTADAGRWLGKCYVFVTMSIAIFPAVPIYTRRLSAHLVIPYLPVSYRLDRFEMKFVITREQRDALMPHLLPHLRADVNAGDDAFYPIISLYYDNPDRDCYWEKIRGQGSRRKTAGACLWQPRWKAAADLVHRGQAQVRFAGGEAAGADVARSSADRRRRKERWMCR